jgi:hypothetical protein
MYDDPTPTHEDAEQASTWINNELTWEDVYSKKPVEYLEAIARGETPRWDSEKGGYVYGNSTSGEIMLGGDETYADPQANAEVDEDLPF